MHSKLKVLIIFTVMSLVAAACGGDAGQEVSGEFESIGATAADGAGQNDDAATSETTAAATSETTAAAAPEEQGGSDTASAGGADDAVGNGGVTAVVATPTQLGRDIIFTAELTLAVENVAEAGQAAGRVIQRVGGFLFGQDTQGGAKPRTVLVFKVLPEDFQEALAQLGSIGEVRNQKVSADDVTERVVDLRSRINTAEASVERLRGFLENADDLETIATLENQLLQRETDLETLRGQLRTLEDQVALATIVLTLTQARINPAVAVEPSYYVGSDDGGFACPGAPSLVVDQDETITACFRIVNTGDVPLTAFTLNDPVLDLELADLTLVSGDPGVSLSPGDTLVYSTTLVVEENLRPRTTVTARPTAPDGTVLDVQPVANTVSGSIGSIEPEGIAGFGDGLAASWALLLDAGRLALLVLGWLVPFSWIFALAFWWMLRRRHRRSRTEPTRAEKTQAEPTQADPPQPVPAKTGAADAAALVEKAPSTGAEAANGTDDEQPETPISGT